MSKLRGLRSRRRQWRRRHEESAAKLAAAIIRQEQETRPTANDTKPAPDAADIEHAAGDVPAGSANYHSMT